MLSFHQGAKPSTFDHAQELRQRQTKAEKILWSLLRNRQLKGKKFRRQHPILHYVADFYCHESKLVIEVDGNFRKKAEVKLYDQARTTLLNELGITVLRFWNEEVINDAPKVLSQIENYL
jgi:very-short-patch-repair endonuclease